MQLPVKTRVGVTSPKLMCDVKVKNQGLTLWVVRNRSTSFSIVQSEHGPS